jgi:hypothetical protein
MDWSASAARDLLSRAAVKLGANDTVKNNARYDGIKVHACSGSTAYPIRSDRQRVSVMESGVIRMPRVRCSLRQLRVIYAPTKVGLRVVNFIYF